MVQNFVNIGVLGNTIRVLIFLVSVIRILLSETALISLLKLT